jgi:Uncharacterized conserved protein
MNMNFAITALIEFFKAHDWDYKEDNGRPVIYTGVNGENAQLRCLASAGENNEHLVFISIFPVQAPPKKRARCAELLTRINYDLIHGCFEMDFEDGEIRFRTSIGALDLPIAPKQVEHLIFTNLSTMDRYIAPIMRVLYTSERPDDALYQSLLIPFPRFSLN